MSAGQLEEYEQQIINEFKTMEPGKGGGQAVPRKGMWILGHLRIHQANYIQDMFDRYVDFTKFAAKQGAKIKPGTLGTFRTYVWLLRKPVPPLLLLAHTVPGKSPLPQFYRRYYKLNPEMLHSPLWHNPYAQYASWQAQKERGFPKPE